MANADQLEAIPFVRDISPLDLLDLPRGLFESLPHPKNLKRSPSAGGPIWPPVLTNVLINGLLILHHKPHLVGKQGLEEHYNWLSAFIFRQTRGWDHHALARNTIEIARPTPGKRAVGIIRSRKQISSKVQTIGEYLKDTHWSYVTQGPRQSPRTLEERHSVSSAVGPSFISPSAAENLDRVSSNLSEDDAAQVAAVQANPAASSEAFDLSGISLDLCWLPPTPFSLPATPSHSPFLYPADVPSYELVDARLVGFDPRDWPHYESQSSELRRQIPPRRLESHFPAKRTVQQQPEGGFSLIGASLTVDFGDHSSAAAKAAGHPLPGVHVLALLPIVQHRSAHTVSKHDLQSGYKQLLDVEGIQGPIVYVDLPIHFPATAQAHANSPADFQVKGSVTFRPSTSVSIPAQELRIVSQVYLIQDHAEDPRPPQRLAVFDEYSSVEKGSNPPIGSFTSPNLAASFFGSIWSDLNRGAQYCDVSRYVIVQRLLWISGAPDSQPLLTIVLAPRVASFPQSASARQVIEWGGPALSSRPPDVPTPPEPVYADRLIASPVPSALSQRATTSSPPSQEASAFMAPNSTRVQHSSPRSSYHPSPTIAAKAPFVGPSRNGRPHARTGSFLFTRPTSKAATTSPVAQTVNGPMSPRTSPVIAAQRRYRTTVPLVPNHISYAQVPFAGISKEGSLSTTSFKAQSDAAGREHKNRWSATLGGENGAYSTFETPLTYPSLVDTGWHYGSTAYPQQ